jgi:hypothetical protein
MNSVVFGLVAVVAGVVFCFRGYLAFRVVIPIWGAFVGFSFGAGLVAGLGDDRFLGSAVAWVVALAVAFVFAALAYFFFEVAVAMAMGSIGFALGTTLLIALGVDWTWLVILAGVALGIVLAYFAIVTELPMILLVVLSATGGASAITTGLLLVTGALKASELSDSAAVENATHWWWYALYFGLALAGIIVQVTAMNERSASLREAWAAKS